MAFNRYSESFKRTAARQVLEGRQSVAQLAKQLGVTTKSPYEWVDRYKEEEMAYPRSGHIPAEGSSGAG